MTAAGRPDRFEAPPWPKRPARLGTAVVDVLLDRIVAGELEPPAALLEGPALRLARSRIADPSSIAATAGA